MNSIQPVTTDSAPRESLDTILDLSRQMLVAAQAGDWDHLLVVEKTRRILIEEGFSSTVPSNDAAAMAACIEEILKIDNEVIGMAGTAKTAIAAQLGDLRKKKKALKAYTAMEKVG